MANAGRLSIGAVGACHGISGKIAARLLRARFAPPRRRRAVDDVAPAQASTPLLTWQQAGSVKSCAWSDPRPVPMPASSRTSCATPSARWPPTGAPAPVASSPSATPPCSSPAGHPSRPRFRPERRRPAPASPSTSARSGPAATIMPSFSAPHRAPFASRAPAPAATSSRRRSPPPSRRPCPGGRVANYHRINQPY